MPEKRSIQIKDSYRIWRPNLMKCWIISTCYYKYGSCDADKVLNRSYPSMYIEWWLHNIGYYLTRNIALFDVINLRCRDVDLEEHI